MLPMRNPTCLITGANRGIGAATAEALAHQGADVVLLCRDEASGRTTADRINRHTKRSAAKILVADLASLASVRTAAERFASGHDRLEVLINNAAVVSRRRRVTEDGYELQFAVNHLAPFLLTNLLRPLLTASAPARVVTVSSGAHYKGEIDLSDLHLERDYDPYRAYRRSKLANVLFTRALARRLAGTGVTANAVHPGVIATGLLGALAHVPRPLAGLLRMVAGSPRAGADRVVAVATDPGIAEVTGAYFSEGRQAEPSATARDADLAERLWMASAQLTGLSDDA